ncbi:hypothetical protein FA95DRAFT_1230966 [Auriscalpium vulgare]|uniref:Uncharacterized protein n=1 Tax=Auriscalpium vulgare TaxID=40419 RepID=A0ACB8RTE9_9AGAM|nr:hypothetical protein FA95DRAFT_1230966 [Auriscalpium vulgare]
MPPARGPINFSTLRIGQLQSTVSWLIGLVDQGPVDAPDDGVVDTPPRHHFLLLCDHTETDHLYVWHRRHRPTTYHNPSSATPAAWAPRPLPASLSFTTAFTPYTASLAPALATLPAPMTYNIRPLEGARVNAASSVGMANSLRQRGNEAYAARNPKEALVSYTMAVTTLAMAVALLEGHGAVEIAPLHAQLAVCLANRAAAFLLEGPDMDTQRALSDGMSAERADAGYVKGYLRQMRAHLLLGDVVQARSALERASRQARGADVQIVADALAALSKST